MSIIAKITSIVAQPITNEAILTVSYLGATTPEYKDRTENYNVPNGTSTTQISKKLKDLEDRANLDENTTNNYVASLKAFYNV